MNRVKTILILILMLLKQHYANIVGNLAPWLCTDISLILRVIFYIIIIVYKLN